MSKRKLPSILRKDVSPLPITNDVSPLIAHPSVGKVIRHRSRSVIILTVHENLRLVTDGRYSFWIPRRPANRKEMKDERIRRQYVSGVRVAFRTPHWTGEPRPDLESLPLTPSNVLTLADARRLVSEFGFDANAAFTSISRSQMSGKSDRRRLGVFQTDSGKWLDRTKIAQPIPYMAAPSRRTETGGGFSRDSVLRAVSQMRASDNMRFAVFEVVFRRRFPSQIAGEFGVGVRALNKAATRIRKTIRQGGEKSSQMAAPEAVVGIPCA